MLTGNTSTVSGPGNRYTTAPAGKGAKNYEERRRLVRFREARRGTLITSTLAEELSSSNRLDLPQHLTVDVCSVRPDGSLFLRG